MIRKFLILLCLCCVVLCAIVGYLSKQIDQEADKREGEAKVVKCADFLEDPPAETARILVTDFGLGKHFAHIDKDGDDQWDEMCVPFFPTNLKLNKYGYTAVLVCLKDVKSKAELKELTKDNTLDTNYWPRRQELNKVFHSQLAQQYTNMDFSKTVVLHYGYDSSNPILGEMSLKISMIVGGAATLIGLLCLLSFLFIRSKPTDLQELLDAQPTTNRAGLPIA